MPADKLLAYSTAVLGIAIVGDGLGTITCVAANLMAGESTSITRVAGAKRHTPSSVCYPMQTVMDCCNIVAANLHARIGRLHFERF